MTSKILGSIGNWTARFWWVFPAGTIVFSESSLHASDLNLSLVALLIVWGLTLVTLFLQLPVFLCLIVQKKWWPAVGAFLLGIVSLVFSIPILFITKFFTSYGFVWW